MKQCIYIYNNGTIRRKDNTVQFITEDGVKKDLPIESISDIYFMSEGSLNTSLLNLLSQYGIIVHFFNYYSFYTGSFYPKETLLAGQLLVKQVEAYTNSHNRLYIARQFVDGAAYNIYRNLRYYNGRGKDLQGFMDEIERLRAMLMKANDIEQLMGFEGNIHKVYYKAWNIIIDRPIDFDKRVKNPPDNMINTLISYVNTLIYTRVLSEIYKTQLNPTISYLHQPGTRRFSLSLDIAEIYKPLIGDRLIFSMLNKNQIDENSFTKELNFLHLKKQASQEIMAQLDKRLKTTIMHRELEKEVSYEYLMRLECYKLIKHLLGEKNYDSFKIWW